MHARAEGSGDVSSPAAAAMPAPASETGSLIMTYLILIFLLVALWVMYAGLL